MYTMKGMMFVGKLLKENYPEEFKAYFSLSRETRRKLLEILDISRPSSIYEFLYKLNQSVLNMYISDNKFGDTVGLGSFSTLPKYVD